MVRLKHIKIYKRANCIMYFNSTMVRLKPIVCDLLSLRDGYFNSTMVRLKLSPLSYVVCVLFSFQFHNGSIKALDIDKFFPGLMPFQFHNGSIKALQYITMWGMERNFNSTMVRLKRHLPFFLAPIDLDFNSTMVRLKRWIFSKPIVFSSLFQFHNGSIKAVFWRRIGAEGN